MRGNRTLFFGIIGAAVLVVVAMVVARFLLISSDPVQLTVLYSTEKEAWLDAVMDDFEGQVNGRPIEISLEKMGSREMYLAVLDGEEQPDLISPASSLQSSILEELSPRQFGQPLVRANDESSCRSVVQTPLVLVAWQERASVLWGDNPGDSVWRDLQEAVVHPDGWAAYNHPEWGFIKFTHTNPQTSNSGLMTALLMTYGYAGSRSGLTADVVRDSAFQDWFIEFERMADTSVSSTGTLMGDIVSFGPSKYDIGAVYESTAIEQVQNAAARYGALQIYYPPATIMSDHPFCVLDAEWVTDDKAQAAQVFIDYLLSEPVQQQALTLGFRPVNNSVSLSQPSSPFDQYIANGVKLDIPPDVDIPAGNVLEVLINLSERSAR